MDGVVGQTIYVRNDAVVSIKGGSAGRLFRVYGNGVIYLYGSGFSVTVATVTTGLSNGDRLTDFGTSGTITGTLADGSALANTFEIFNTGSYAGATDIVIVDDTTVTTCDYVLAGDVDGNCKVDFGDLAMIAINWLTNCNANPFDPACIPKAE